MSKEKDAPAASNGSKVFSSQDFMQFLATHSGDISTLELTTKAGDRISAAFNGQDDQASVFKSIETVKSLLSESSTKTPALPTSAFVNAGRTSVTGPGSFVSKDWAIEYGKDHVDVTYDQCFADSGSSSKQSQVFSAPTLPPKKRAGKKTDWNAMLTSALSPLVEAATRATPQSVGAASTRNIRPETQGSMKTPVDGKALGKASRRKPRKIVPENKEYIDQYTDQDVLFGRGGRSNHHLGNKLYRELVTKMQPHYKGCDKNEKTKVAQSIVDIVHKEQKGRFLELCKQTDRYFIVPNIMARRKVGQALRENNTEEARAAKREKYGQGKSKKSVVGSTSPSTSSASATLHAGASSAVPMLVSTQQSSAAV